MLNNPSILKQAYEDINQLIGRSRRLEETNISNLFIFIIILALTDLKLLLIWTKNDLLGRHVTHILSTIF